MKTGSVMSFFKIYGTKILLRFGLLVDFVVYAKSLNTYRAFARALPPSDKGSILIVSGRGMNISWAQVWPLLSLPLRLKGYRGLVLTMRKQRLLNAYYSLLGLQFIYLDDLGDPALPAELAAQIEAAKTFEDFRALSFRDAPIGQIGLSTYSRHQGTGLIELEKQEVVGYVRQWVRSICAHMLMAEAVFDKEQVKILFFTEVFMEEYGAFYYAALRANLNVIRFAGTVRDDAFIMQHLSRANDRIHHSSIDKTTFEKLKVRTDDAKMEEQLMQNFRDRYGEKWHRSKRNQPGTIIEDPAKAREALGLAPGRKVAVIYSHILYDTLFFFGTDLFKDYAEWLKETVRAAIENPHVDWLVKVHPSNLWRGELDTLLKGKYEEERLLKAAFGKLPPHVRIVPADTKFSPLTWFQLADYGVTVRGTSGLEMAALGKTVVTAGTGRYEGNGFTIDPPDAASYLHTLKTLHELPAPTAEQVRWAKRYAHGIFVRKPFTLRFLKTRLRFGRKKVYASDDLIYTVAPLEGTALPPDMLRFGEWALTTQDRDLLSED